MHFLQVSTVMLLLVVWGSYFRIIDQRNMIKQKGENMLKAVVYPGGWDGEAVRRGVLDGEHMCARG